MNKTQALVFLATLVSAVDEAGVLGAPSGVMYAGLMQHLSLDDYNAILGIAKQMGYVTESHFLVTITPKGKDFVQKVNAALKA